MSKKINKVPNELKVLCPYCNAPWTVKMEHEMGRAFNGCSSCGYGEEANYKITIICSKCKRIVYVKEGVGS